MVGGVVVIVRVAVATPAVTPTGVVVPNVNVGRSCAPAGLDVSVAASATLPVKPPLGVTEIIEIFAVVAPGAIETALPLTVKLGGTGGITVTEVVAELVL